MRAFADPDVAYVCGRLRLQAADGSNQEGVYWRYELLTRDAESRLGSVTGGNGSIYAVRRSDYVEVDPRFGHDLSLPYALVQRGRRAVYDPEALAFEKPTPTNETEYRRKVRMFEHCWLIVAKGRMLRRQPPGYLVALVSHRHLRYGSGLLHLLLLGSSASRSSRRAAVYAVGLGLQLGVLAAAAVGVGLPRYYVARHLGDERRALELPPARRPRDLDAGGGDALIWHHMTGGTETDADPARRRPDRRARRAGGGPGTLALRPVREAIDLLLGTGDAAAIDAAIVEGYRKHPPGEFDAMARRAAEDSIREDPW